MWQGPATPPHLFTVREIQIVGSCLSSTQNEFHRDFVLTKITFAVQKSFRLKAFWCKSTGFNTLSPSPLARLEPCQGGVRTLSSVLCTELTLLGRAPVHRGFLTDVTAVLRAPLCAPFLSIPQQIQTLPIPYLSCQYCWVGAVPPAPWALPKAMPVAGSAADAAQRGQAERLLQDCEREREEAACQKPRRDARSGCKEL